MIAGGREEECTIVKRPGNGAVECGLGSRISPGVEISTEMVEQRSIAVARSEAESAEENRTPTHLSQFHVDMPLEPHFP